jgi:hypothetical protein
MTLVVRPGRRAATSLVSAGLAAILAASAAFASTPVTVGYRDRTYGGSAFRPSADKPQSKLWYTDGSWFAGMFLYQTTSPAKSEYRIYRLDGAHNWVLTSAVVDTRDTSHADYLWDEAHQTLYAISVPKIPSTIPTVVTDDGIKVFKYTYNAATNVYTPAAGFPKLIQNTASVPNVSTGGSPTVTIALDSTGRLWATWLNNNEVRYSKSDDGGLTWADPAQLPAQAGNSVVTGPTDSNNDSAAVIGFGAGSPNKVGILWSDQDNIPGNADNGFFFAVINAGDDPSIGTNWTTTKLPTLVGTNETADGHINIKTTSDGSVYVVGKTPTDTAQCATNKNSVLTEFFARTPAGSWSVHLVGTVGDCNTRPQLLISEELDTAYIFLTSPNGGGTVYRKSAPLSGADAYDFRGAADQTLQPGTPFIQSATETMIDDASTTKQVVTSASGIVVIANNLLAAGTPNVKYYLHNEMAIPTSDAAAPVGGTVSINAGAVGTTSTAVSVAIPATDAGSGVSLVRVSNSSTLSGGILTTGTTYVYPGGANPTIAWTLASGDGTKTVYVQWRDSTGNWSALSNDTIMLDATAPTGTVVINGGAATTTTAAVTLTLTTDDGAGSGTTQVLISNSADFTGVTPVAYATSLPWTLTGGNSSKTVYVKFIDAAGNTSAAPATDDINLDSPDVTPPTSPGVPKQWLAGTGTSGIPIRINWTAGTDPAEPSSGVAGYVLQESVNGGAFATIAQPSGTTIDLTRANMARTYRYRVATRDLSGNLSPYATGPTFKAITYSESSSMLTYTGKWVLSNTPTYIGGLAKYSTTAGSTATASINGSRVGWLSRTGPTSGTARVYVDGVLRKTVNLYAATTGIRQLVFTYSWTTVGNHKLKIVVSGTAGHPRVTLDQILVLR